MFELRSQMSITAVAEWLDVDPDTVKDAEKRILEAKYRRVDRKGVRMIGIDELYVFGNERSNRKYITVVRDMETGTVLNVSRGGGVFPTSLRQPYPTMQILIIPGLYVLFLRIGLRRLQIKLILPRIASMNPRT